MQTCGAVQFRMESNFVAFTPDALQYASHCIAAYGIRHTFSIVASLNTFENELYKLQTPIPKSHRYSSTVPVSVRTIHSWRLLSFLEDILIYVQTTADIYVQTEY